jgi:hypothetical protein
MIANPKLGQTVQIWYKKSLADWFPLHGKVGSVAIVCKARKCRNHGVLVDGKVYAIPCGNLRPFKEAT